MIVGGVQPVARLGVVAADESVERAIDAQKKQRELAFLASRVEAARRLSRDTDASLVPIISASCLLRRPSRSAAEIAAFARTESGIGTGSERGAAVRIIQVQYKRNFFHLQVVGQFDPLSLGMIADPGLRIFEG